MKKITIIISTIAIVAGAAVFAVSQSGAVGETLSQTESSIAGGVTVTIANVPSPNYAQNGLIMNLDGIDSPHTDTTWTDISGNGNDGRLTTHSVANRTDVAGFNAGGGWQGNGLVFRNDGADLLDYVKIKQIDLPENTLEIVASHIGMKYQQHLIANVEHGGSDLKFHNNNSLGYEYFNNGAYQQLGADGSPAIGEIFSLSGSSDGAQLQNLYNLGDLKATATNGEYGAPADNTVWALGANPAGGSVWTGSLFTDAQPFSGTIYAARMYDRALTENELRCNHALDAVRYQNAAHENVDFAPCGLTVTLDGISATDVKFVADGVLSFTIPPHVAGTVDIVVNIGGKTITLANGFTYVDNCEWNREIFANDKNCIAPPSPSISEPITPNEPAIFPPNTGFAKE